MSNAIRRCRRCGYSQPEVEALEDEADEVTDWALPDLCIGCGEHLGPHQCLCGLMLAAGVRVCPRCGTTFGELPDMPEGDPHANPDSGPETL